MLKLKQGSRWHQYRKGAQKHVFNKEALAPVLQGQETSGCEQEIKKARNMRNKPRTASFCFWEWREGEETNHPLLRGEAHVARVTGEQG